MKLDVAVFAAGVVLISLVGFFSPVWYLGFVPLGAGAIWAAYFLIGADRGATRPAP